ncbi:hypothetical protein [Fusibacter ferrireducens]|uniref:DUF304 domain-containing protein n=1 Tax=Fusibacter ferrireducens TaxID=2785058 RepID=A0ABR9ZQ49_9FIRM|nr:hypothetical protein [Fusibacter ferrireducens]MBF4692055.1 hypothetical protein [Fusibacter ferrireducens]
MIKFEVNRRKQIIYAAVIAIVALIIIGNNIVNIVKLTQIPPQTMDIQVENTVQTVTLSSSKSEIGMNVFCLLITLVFSAVYFYYVFIVHRAIEIDEDFIHLYPRFNVIHIPWCSIKSVHLGYMRDEGSAVAFYRMRIFYILEGETLKPISIPLLRFQDHKEIADLIQKRCHENHIDFFKV